MEIESKTAAVLASNLTWLMERFGQSERDLERLSGVSAKTINNIKNARHGAKIDVIEAIAAPFGLSVSQITCPLLPLIYDVRRDTERLATIFANSSKEARALIMLIADREDARPSSPIRNELKAIYPA